MIQKIGIVGLGALGIMYAELFQDTLGREQVYVIADRERVRRYREEGVYSNGERCDFRYMEAEEAQEMDLLIFATKYTGWQRRPGMPEKPAGSIRSSCRYSTESLRRTCWAKFFIRRTFCTARFREWTLPEQETA